MKASILARTAMSRIAGIGRDRRGVAAVEFALILPFMLTVYLGSTEMTHALMASRKATLVARALSDLVSQQQNQTNFNDTQLAETFAAANAIISPFPTSGLKMTVTSVDFVTNAGAVNGYDAKPRWSAVSNGGALRPCQILTPVANTATPTPTTLPNGIYAAGSVIVADVIYTYTPTFGSSFFTSAALMSAVTYRHTTYMRPRAWSTYIPYTGANATICPNY